MAVPASLPSAADGSNGSSTALLSPTAGLLSPPRAILPAHPALPALSLLIPFALCPLPQGGRVYDSKYGVTCHWCRQKTLEEHVTCSHPDCGDGRRLAVSFW